MSQDAKKIDSYRGLLVWQKSMDLVVISYQVAKRLPASELYGLTSQIQRAAVSVPSNIAEGYGRHHLGDYLHHLSVANGSLKELETHLLIAQRLSYLRESDIEAVLALAEEVGRMLRGLASALRRKSRADANSGSDA
jgi:four helix bundle protein